MTIAWMIYVLLVGVLLALAAWCGESALRHARLPTRWVWAITLVGIVAFAAVALRTNSAPVATSVVATPITATLPNDVQSTAGIAAMIEAFRAAIVTVMGNAVATGGARVPADVVRFMLIGWAALSVSLMLAQLVARRRVARERRAWPQAALPGGTARVAPAIGPAVIGLASPEVVVPQWLLEKTAEEQRLVMVHELEHIAARDQFLPFGALLVATVLPWHPAVWWSLARLRLAMELDCDARVLRRGERAQSYGKLLIDIAARCGGHRVGALALADRTSHLERRILAMTQQPRRFATVRAVALVGVTALTIITACEAKLPTSSEVQALDVASTETALVRSKMLDERTVDNVVYEVNGVRVSAVEAHALPSSRIATVNVLKGTVSPAGTRPTTIRIATSDSLGAGARMRVFAKKGDPMLETPSGTLVQKERFAGLLYVDGVLSPEGAVSKLKPDEIASIDILKGEAARSISTDPSAANGIIKVTTKSALDRAIQAKRGAEKAAP